MKIFTYTFGLIILFVLSACGDSDVPGPRGPAGPQGPEGAPGESGFVFEYENINFTAPNYDVILSYPDNFEGLASDVAVVYLLWDVENIDGEDVEIWRQLSQTVITNDGILQYNFDFTKYDVRLFLDAQFPLDNLTAMDTDEWVARVVIVPGEFWNSAGRMDLSNYHQVKEMLGLPEFAPRDGVSRRALKVKS